MSRAARGAWLGQPLSTAALCRISEFLVSYKAARAAENEEIDLDCSLDRVLPRRRGGFGGRERTKTPSADLQASLRARRCPPRPMRRHATDGYEYSGAELQLTGRKMFEVDSCSMDSSRCILYYSKKGKCLRIDSIGERLRDMTVTRWADECPGAPPEATLAALKG